MVDRSEAIGMAWEKYGGPPEHLKDLQYGAGMIASFTKKEGEVFCAGTADWVVGLTRRDFYTETITFNVLNRFSGTNLERR